MNGLSKIIMMIIVMVSLYPGKAAAEIDPTLEKLNLSGFLRIRAWYTTSKNKFPDKFPATDGYESVYYQDLFFRNRFGLNVLQNLEVRAVFDIFAYFGKGDYALGSGGTNIVTRDVYAIFGPSENSKLLLGLQPFSLPGGYILARDATGIQYNHHFWGRKLKVYLSIIKAFDDADGSFGEDSAPPDYSDDNIYFLGFKWSITSGISAEAYYVNERDRYTEFDETSGDPIDGRESSLNWAGLHLKIDPGNWIFHLGGIYNFGHVWNTDGAGKTSRVDTNAWLFEFETGYKFSNLQLGIIAEGATGDPNDSDANNSFQDIKSSHGFSFIVVDNTGGISLRESGESSWYGLYGGGLKLQLTLFNTFLLTLKLLDFRTTEELTWKGSTSNWLGDEFDFLLEYRYQEALSVFLNAGAFFPQEAYFALDDVQHDSGGVIAEVMLGAMVNY